MFLVAWLLFCWLLNRKFNFWRIFNVIQSNFRKVNYIRSYWWQLDIRHWWCVQARERRTNWRQWILKYPCANIERKEHLSGNSWYIIRNFQSSFDYLNTIRGLFVDYLVSLQQWCGDNPVSSLYEKVMPAIMNIGSLFES